MSEYVFRLVDEDDPAAHEDLRSLDRWLGDREELDAEVSLRMRPPGPGEMGGEPQDIVVVAAAATLARAYFGWLRERVRTRRVAMTVRDEFRKQEIKIVAGSGDDVKRLMEALKNFFDEVD